nr:carboxymuconolactone decarboxylase family protein [Heliomarina baculiformis]
MSCPGQSDGVRNRPASGPLPELEIYVNFKTIIVTAALSVTLLAHAAPASAQETATEAFAEIERAFGFVPSFFKVYPEHGVAAAWRLTRDLEISQTTELSAREKALINIAVAAQIPCQFCVFADTQAAKAAGATDGEIREAVAQAALTRHWSTIMNGMQVDFADFREEFGD